MSKQYTADDLRHILETSAPDAITILGHHATLQGKTTVKILLDSNCPSITKIKFLEKFRELPNPPVEKEICSFVLDAVRDNDYALAQALLEYAKKTNCIDFTWHYENTGNYIVHLPIQNQNPEMLGLLLQYGADPNQANFKDKKTPLRMLLESNCSTAIKIRFLEKFKALQPPPVEKEIGNYILNAVSANDYALAQALLEYAKITNCITFTWYCTDTGNHAIHQTIQNQSPDMFALLIQYGANPNQANFKDKKTPLRMLLESNCSTAIKIRFLETFKTIQPRPVDKDICSYALDATQADNYALTQALLEYAKITNSIDFSWHNKNNGNYAIHDTIQNKNPDMFALLIQYGADPNQANLNNKKTPLQLAFETQYPDGVKIFKEFLIQFKNCRSKITINREIIKAAVQNPAMDFENTSLFHAMGFDTANENSNYPLMEAFYDYYPYLYSSLLADNISNHLIQNLNEQNIPKFIHLMEQQILSAIYLRNNIHLQKILNIVVNASATYSNSKLITILNCSYFLDLAIRRKDYDAVELLLKQRTLVYADENQTWDAAEPHSVLLRVLKSNYTSEEKIRFILLFKKYKIKCKSIESVFSELLLKAPEVLQALFEYIDHTEADKKEMWIDLPQPSDIGNYLIHTVVLQQNLQVFKAMVTYCIHWENGKALKNRITQETPLEMLDIKFDRQFKIEVIKIFHAIKLSFKTIHQHILHAAVTKDRELLQVLVAYAKHSDSDSNFKTTDEQDRNPLHHVVENNDFDSTLLFLDLIGAEAALNKQNKAGKTPIDLVLTHSVFTMADKITFVKKLQDKNICCVNIDIYIALAHFENNQPLLLVLETYKLHIQRVQLEAALHSGNLEKTEEVLTPALLETKLNNETPLQAAARLGQQTIVKRLVARGARTDVTDEKQARPVHISKNPEVKAVLVGAELFQQNFNLNFNAKIIAMKVRCEKIFNALQSSPSKVATHNHSIQILKIAFECIDITLINNLNINQKIDLHCTLSELLRIVSEAQFPLHLNNLNRFKSKLQTFFDHRTQAISNTELDYCFNNSWANTICYRIANEIIRADLQKEYDSSAPDQKYNEQQQKLYQEQQQQYFRLLNQHHKLKETGAESKAPTAPIRPQLRPVPPPPPTAIDILMARAKTQKRHTPWEHPITRDDQLPVIETKNGDHFDFFRIDDEIHIYTAIIDKAFDQLRRGHCRVEDIWLGTDIKWNEQKDAKIPAKPQPLSKNALQLLKQRSPSLQALVCYTEKLNSFEGDFQKDLVARFSEFREGLRKADAHGSGNGTQLIAGSSAHDSIYKFYTNFWSTLAPDLRRAIEKISAVVEVDEGLGKRKVQKSIGDVLEILLSADSKDDRSKLKYCIGTQGEILEDILKDQTAKDQLAALKQTALTLFQIRDAKTLDAWHTRVTHELQVTKPVMAPSSSYLNNPDCRAIMQVSADMNSLDYSTLISLQANQQQVTELLQAVQNPNKHKNTQKILQSIFNQKSNAWLLELYNRLKDRNYDYLRARSGVFCYFSRYYTLEGLNRVQTSKSWSAIERAIAHQMIANATEQQADVKALCDEHKFITNHRKHRMHVQRNDAPLKQALVTVGHRRAEILKDGIIDFRYRIIRLLQNDQARLRVEIAIEENSLFPESNKKTKYLKRLTALSMQLLDNFTQNNLDLAETHLRDCIQDIGDVDIEEQLSGYLVMVCEEQEEQLSKTLVSAAAKRAAAACAAEHVRPAAMDDHLMQQGPIAGY